MFDVIIIGGGHNGLVCAAYLARAGKSVALVEARSILGGFTTTESPFSNHPEVRMPMAAMDLATANMPPSIIDDLDLRSHGLKLIDVDPFYSYVAPDGTSLIFWRDVDRTCGEIQRISPADAVAYRAFMADMAAFWRTVAPYMHSNPLRPSLRALASMAGNGLSRPGHIMRAARIMMMSPKAALETTFESEALRAALGNFAAASTAPLDQPGSGLILAVMAMQHQWGVTRPVGGMGAFADVLAKFGTEAGVRFFTGQPASSLMIENGRAIGVRLADSTELTARSVVGAIDPKTLMLRLLPPEHRNANVTSELTGMTVFGSNIASARIDLLLSSVPSMVINADRARKLLPTSMLVGPTSLAAIQSYVAGCAGGILGDDIPVWAACPTMLDPTLVPDGSRQAIYVYVPAVPFRLSSGQPWSDQRDRLGDIVVRQLESVLPDLGSLIQARSVRTPEDLEAVSGLTGGCMYHADMSLAQMGPWRPVPSMAGFKTPIPGLWHTGAGAHPMGSVNGISGKLASQALLRNG